MTFYLMSGVPGSGKSTYAKKHFPNAHIVSTDDIRMELFGKYEVPKDKARLVWETAWKRIAENIKSDGADIVFDATNTVIQARARVLSHVPSEIHKVAIVMKTPVSVAQARNADRERVVPPQVINRMAIGQTYPTKKEGFDEIVFVG